MTPEAAAAYLAIEKLYGRSDRRKDFMADPWGALTEEKDKMLKELELDGHAAAVTKRRMITSLKNGKHR